MSKATTTVEGFVANDLEVREVNGSRVVKVTVPHTPRKFNKQSNQWEDAGETVWFSASFWDEQADAVLGAVGKRMLVAIAGTPSPRGYQKQDGSVGVETELKFATLGVIPRATVASVAPVQSVADQWADNTITPGTQAGAEGWAASDVPF